MDIALSILVTAVIIFVVPIVVYGAFVRFAGLAEPEKKMSFLLGVLVQKLGTAVGFVTLFVLASDYFADNWLLYGLIWAGMFAIVEIGQAIAPGYSRKEAAAGIISELVYFPLASFVAASIIR